MITSAPVLVNVVADPVISLEPLATDTLCVGGSPYLPLGGRLRQRARARLRYQWFLGDGTCDWRRYGRDVPATFVRYSGHVRCTTQR